MKCVVCGNETTNGNDTCSGKCWLIQVRLEAKEIMKGNIGVICNNGGLK